MTDTYAHFAEIVRASDRERYLSDLFAPEAARRHLFALHAFAAEVARIRDKVSEPAAGEIRLKWWGSALRGDHGGSPVASALAETIAAFGLPIGGFDNLLEARVFDLYDDPMPSLNDLEGYAGDTGSGLMQLAALILAGGKDPDTAELSGYGGVATAMTGLMRSLPRHAAAGQSYLPADLLERHGADPEDIAAGRTTPALRSVLADLRAVVREHLAVARRLCATLDPALLPAFLPVALVEPHLRRMERPGFDPLRDSAELSPVRRQWILWRAARRGRF
jgi:phytoene synthase